MWLCNNPVITYTFNRAKDAAAGIGYLHNLSILHCDLALRNLFVSMNNTIKYTVKIGDFGLAKPLGDSNVVVSSTNVIFVVSLDLTHL